MCSSDLDALRRLADHRNDAREHFAEVAAHFGENHPEYRKAQAQLRELDSSIATTQKQIADRVEVELHESERREQMVKDAVGDAKFEFDRMNARSVEYQALKREADADKSLYEQLVKKIKEAGINAGFQSNAVRIADAARPALKPVFPNTTLNLLLALLFSTILAVGGAVLADMLDKTVRDPEQVARTLRTEVIGSLPLLKKIGRAHV